VNIRTATVKNGGGFSVESLCEKTVFVLFEQGAAKRTKNSI
jgi:hypothetical protein